MQCQESLSGKLDKAERLTSLFIRMIIIWLTDRAWLRLFLFSFSPCSSFTTCAYTRAASMAGCVCGTRALASACESSRGSPSRSSTWTSRREAAASSQAATTAPPESSPTKRQQQRAIESFFFPSETSFTARSPSPTSRLPDDLRELPQSKSLHSTGSRSPAPTAAVAASGARSIDPPLRRP